MVWPFASRVEEDGLVCYVPSSARGMIGRGSKILARKKVISKSDLTKSLLARKLI